jgi:Family of unknown function (DUF6011)
MTDATTTEDPLGRTPEQVAADKQRAAENRARITARDWHEVPKGHYAVPVPDLSNAEWEASDYAGEPPVMAYRLFERRVARQCKNGRVIGHERFITGGIMLAGDDIDPDHVRHEVKWERDMLIGMFGPKGDLKAVVDDIMRDIADGDTYRAKFGQLTGKCGCCGMRLTDPRSKLIGVGPDCRGYR